MVVTSGLKWQRKRIGDIPEWLDFAKSYLQINGEDHDELLLALLDAAIDTVEMYCAVSLVETEVKFSWAAIGSTESLMYGPVREVGDIPAGMTIVGYIPGDVAIKGESTEPGFIDYVAGYTEVPADLKLAVIKLVVDDFEQRTGTDLSGRQAVQVLPNNWKEKAKRYRKVTWLG